MDFEELENILSECLEKKETVELTERYKDCLTQYLDEKNVSDEIVSIVIKGMDIDGASVFMDYLESLSEDKIVSLGKIIKNCKVLESEIERKQVTFILNLVYMAIVNCGKLRSITDILLLKYTSIISSIKKEADQDLCDDLVADCILMNLSKDVVDNFDWKIVNIQPEKLNVFVNSLVRAYEKNAEVRNQVGLKAWLDSSQKYVNDLLEQKRIESKIPVSKADELKKLLAHYESVESTIREYVYEIDKLEKTIKQMEKENANLSAEKIELQREITSLNGSVVLQQKSLEEAGKEIEERKAMNDAFDALKKNDESALLRDIANELKAEYSDFLESMNDEMDEQLGEIYREKIKNIFAILQKKGVKVE